MTTTELPVGTDLAVRSVGAGPAIGWIHGYTMNSHVFDGIWPLLTGFRHVGVDLPGHGDSPDWPADARLSEVAAGVARALERENVRTLVAVSMGTMVAFEMVIRRLHDLDRLIVIAPALVGMPPGTGTAAQYRMLTAMRRMGVPRHLLSRAWLTAPTGIFAGLREHPEAIDDMAAVVSGHSWSELDAGGPAAFYRERQNAADLPGSAAELMMITGGRDMPEFRDLAVGLAAQVPDARVVHLPEAGHLPLLEEPAVTCAAIRSWLSDSSV